MTKTRRSVYDVDEDALKRMVAGDITALEKIQEQIPANADISAGAPEEKGEAERKASPVPGRKTSGGKKSPQADELDEYRKRFLQMKLTGARRQTYIHDSLYKMCAKVLPVIAPDMSVPTFVNSVLSEHLKRYKNVINAIYNEEASKEAIE